MRGRSRGNDKGREGQGKVIDLTVRPVEIAALDDNVELLQSGFWARFKSSHGWQPYAFSLEMSDGHTCPPLLVMTRSLVRLFTIAYVPFGPGFDPGAGRGELLSRLGRSLKLCLPSSTLLLRFDLPWEKTGEAPTGAGAARLMKAADMQPPDTVIVDISPALDDVLAGMKSKTRYNVRLSAKKGVEVREAGVEELGKWYALYEETSRRDHIAIHSLAYYRGLFETAAAYPGQRPVVKLLLASHEGDLLAGNVVVFWKTRAAYLYGASSGEKRNLMPTYALQWEAIRMAKDAGCTSYDLYGVPPRPDPEHPMFGLYQFKTGFSERVLERWGTWDLPLKPGLYAGYRAAESLRMFYFRGLKKRTRVRQTPG